MPEKSLRLQGLIEGCRAKLRAFIAKRVWASEVDDILQEVVANLVKADGLGQVEMVAAWLFRAAKNEIIDRGRKKKELSLPDWDEGDSRLSEISEVMCSQADGPEEAYLKMLFWQELKEAVLELPTPQREVFVKTELEGISFKELTETTGVNLNTLLTRKRQAILKLRGRLREIYDTIMEL
ncbi:MAG: RNA polymerase sigma factor [Deltaproteobacteria bacterium]|jgi:RNA polymerase sigma factor (sigma-70 family)|nr:RNA polymerase sigma factor [Deltaproteobacteria bacterium]